MAKKYCNKHYCCYEAQEGCVYCEAKKLEPSNTAPPLGLIANIRAWWVDTKYRISLK